MTTVFSDWATNCPVYMGPAVVVRPAAGPGAPPSAEDLGLEPVQPQGEDAVEALVRMAEQIAANHAHLDGPAAAAAVRRHLDRYWTEPMVDRLGAHADIRANVVSAVVREALGRHSRAPEARPVG